MSIKNVLFSIIVSLFVNKIKVYPYLFVGHLSKQLDVPLVALFNEPNECIAKLSVGVGVSSPYGFNRSEMYPIVVVIPLAHIRLVTPYWCAYQGVYCTS
jgi:hypothetical protein